MLALRGLPPLARWDAAAATAALVALAVEQAGPGSLLKIDKALREPFWITEESWGTGPSAEEGMAAMMEMFPASA